MKTIFLISALVLFFTAQLALAEEHKNSQRVIALYAADGQAIHVNELVTTKSETKSFVDNQNLRVELSPYSAAQFIESGEFQILRGSAFLESKIERAVETASAKVEFVGSVLVSYDYKEKSSSAFVMTGQARVQNPHQPQQSSLLDKNQGATMVIGDVFPAAVRGLDQKRISEWLAGYGWSEEYRNRFLKDYPVPGKVSRSPALESTAPEKLAARAGDPTVSKDQQMIPENTALQDYFSSIDNADDSKPHYYEDKLSLETEESKMAKKKSASHLDPEDAALIPLPNVHIDTELPRLTIVSPEEQKRFEEKETAPVVSKKMNRKIASIPTKTKAVAVPAGERNDPDIAATLERLKKLQGSAEPEHPSQKRAPAAISSPIPDPVYDLSENF